MIKNPIKIPVPINTHEELYPIQDWCNQFIGSEGRDWDWSYSDDGDYNYNTIFYFANPKKATLFTLRWP